MIAKIRFGLLWQALVLMLLLGVSSCNTGGTTIVEDPDQTDAPSIFGLSRNSANAGESVKVFGNNFGEDQGSGRVSLNDVDFTINDWSDNELDVTVPAGATSGIVVVTKNSLSSQNGQEAQLYIGAAPNVAPTIFDVSPAYGVRGSGEVLITGQGFEAFSDANGVFFTAGPDTGTEFVEAEVLTNVATGTPRWTPYAIHVRVPMGAQTGSASLYVEVNGVKSNERPFTVQPPALDGEVIITNVDPPQGPVGQQVVVTGNNFGNQQGGSTLTLNGLSLEILVWTNTSITAVIPSGATSGAIRATVGGNVYDFRPDFIVGNAPQITGVSPTEIRIGQPFEVFGKFFGFIQGGGQLMIGSKVLTIESWDNGHITVAALPSLAPLADTENIPVQVTADNGLTSNVVNVSLVSDLAGAITVSPKTGVAQKTNFTFQVSVAGGSGNYDFTLRPEGSGGVEVGGNPPLTHQYANAGTYTTEVEVRDTTTGDIAVITGPSIKVVGPNEIVITQLEAGDFGQPEVSENPWSRTYIAPTFTEFQYNDFVFFNQQIFYTSPLSDLFANNVKLTAFERDQASFLAGSALPKPYGYRRDGGVGGKVRIRGFNLGSDGQIFLNSNGPGGGTLVPAANVVSWGTPGDQQDEIIEFKIPADVNAPLSGLVKVIRADDATKIATSIDPLIVSPRITSIDPDPVEPDGPLQIQGFDMVAPAIPGVTGNTTYMFWVVVATYEDPWTAATVTNQVLMVNPVEVNPVGNVLTFDMASLGPTVAIEAYDQNLANYQVVLDATLADGDYKFFFWTGALPDGSPASDRASSGVFSEVYDIEVAAGGGGPGDDPVAVLTGTPLNGDAPLDVELDASGSSDADGTITKYEFDVDGVAGFEVDNGNNPIYNATFSVDTTARVQVTDNDGNVGIDTVNIDINGGGGGDLDQTVNVIELLETPNPDPDPELTGPLEGVSIDLFDFDTSTLLDTGITDANGDVTFIDLVQGANYYMQPTNPVPPSGDAWFGGGQVIYFNLQPGDPVKQIIDENNFV